MVGTLPYFHKSHSVYRSLRYREWQNYDELFFSIRTSVPDIWI